MVQNPSLERVSDLVIGILLSHPDQIAGGVVQSIDKYRLKEYIRVDVAVQEQGLTSLGYAQALQAKYEDSHILLIHECVYLSSSFLEDVLAQIRYFEDKNVPWGVIGNSGICFPYFKPVSNMLIANSQAEQFAGVLPAAYLDPYLLLIHKGVNLRKPANLSKFPENVPLNDLVGLAAWEADMPCWICNLPVYVESSFATSQPAGDADALARYLSMHYNNASFVSSFGTIEIKDHGAKAKDYYYGQMEPVLNRATKSYDKASVSVFLFATYYDLDVFDRCLMSIVSQFQKPENLYIIGLDKLHESKRFQFKQLVEDYRHYMPIHWADEEISRKDVKDQMAEYSKSVPENGYSLCLYDTFVLFPQAVRQIGEFFQICLGDRNVLPITMVEISRQHRTVESDIPFQPQTFFREVEKLGFDHKEMWLSSRSSSILHFTFPNLFLKRLDLSGVDLYDLGSCVPQRLLAEPVSFFLIDRGAGYMSFQKPVPDGTSSPLREEGTPFHLANKARALLATRSNIIQYSMDADRIMPSVSFQDRNRSSEFYGPGHSRLQELETYHGHAEQEIVRLHQFIQQQEFMLDKYRRSFYYKVRKYYLNSTRPLRNKLRKSQNN
jgi:hypothetical protein